MTRRFWITALQNVSIFLMWGFAAGMFVFVPWLVLVAARWNDSPNWSLAISLVALPVYLTVAATLTYVFIGLRRGAPRQADASTGETDVAAR
jgi:hypothetical protein